MSTSETFNDGGPAFPTETEHQSGPHTWHCQGMSLLDWFAGQALAGTLAREDQYQHVAARIAYEIAMEMLKERERLNAKQS